jgi:hypothetical protein
MVDEFGSRVTDRQGAFGNGSPMTEFAGKRAVCPTSKRATARLTCHLRQLFLAATGRGEGRNHATELELGRRCNAESHHRD